MEPTSDAVIMTPAVADLTGDGIPEIIFTSFPGSPNTVGHLRAIRGDDGSPVFTVTHPDHRLYDTSQLAVGDIDADGQMEIVGGAASRNHLIAFEHTGAFKWMSPVIATGASVHRGGPALADLDGDGHSEVILGATVLDGRTGQILATHLDSTMGRGDNAQGPLSLVADVNGDGVPEIVAGNTLYRYVPDTPVLVQDTPPIRALEVVWHNTDVQDGFPAVATFDDDRTAEIVLVTQGEVVILDGGDGRIRWGPIAIPQGGAGGAPTIGDMDGDGAPEIGVAGSSQYTVFEIADGVLDKKWDIGIYDRSATTGSSVFDFDGDGQAEVVYGDEDYLYVYRGGDAPPALAGDDAAVAAWRTRAKLANPSATAAEMTLVADVDADGHAEIVKVSNGGGMYGIQIYGDQNHAWSATRPLWNQHTYHITNINDDGTIPAREANNWETFNNYRLNTFLSGCATARPDLTASYVRLARETTSLTLTARIGNGGGLFVPAGVPVSWYAGAPANRDLLGTVTTTQRLEPGQYTDIALTLPVGTTTESPVWVVADDQGDGTGRHTEVSETNNAHNAHLYLSATPNTPPVVDAGPDQGTAFYTPTVTLAGNAGDDGLPGDRLQVFWTPVSGPGPVTLADRTDPQTTATFAQAGTYELDLVATDGELTSRDRVTITVEPDPALPTPAPPVPPVPAALSIPGWIGSPATATTISAPLPITLAAGITLQDGTLDYWPADDPTAVTEVATGLSGRGGDTLTTFDPTLLANGSYVVRLTGTADDGRTLASGILVTVAGTYKPGRVRFSVTDLMVPVTGLPITIGRTYDSLERYAVGDFGYGWNLTLGSPDLEVNPQQDVTLTMPNGERVTFYFTPRSYGGLFGALLQPGYTPEAGVYGTLTANGCPIVVAGGGGSSSGYLCFLDRPQYAPTVYTYEDPYGQVFTMAADGTLRTIKDLNGNTLTFSPDVIRSSSGRSVTFDRDAQGRITQITDPAGNVYGYGYDSNGDLVEIDLPGVEPHVQYAYADPAHPHLFTRATDPRGHPAAQTTFSPDGRLERVTDAMGHTTSYAYDVPGRVTTVTNPDGGTLTLVYDAYGMVQSETDPLGRTTTYTYTANRDLAAQTNALGETTSYTYDANGNRTSTTNPRGATWTTSYHRYGGPTHMRDPLGREQTMTYDARFIPTSMQDSLGLIGSATFDDYGNLLGFTDGNGHTVSYVYDQYGNQTQTTNQLNHTTVMTYDPLGRQVTETDARNFTTRYAYDALGRLRTVTQPEVQTPDGPVTPLIQYDYDANGNRTAMIDPLNRRTVYGYDAANRLIETRFPDTSTITHTYDWRGNVIFTQDQAGHITAYAYDLAGQLVAETHADGTPDAGTITYAYDLAGRRTTVTDPLGHTTSYAYDAADNLVSVTNARNATTRYAYDAANQQVSMTDARGNTTAYAYNPRGLLTVTTYHDGTTSAQTYDIVGRTISATDQEHHVTQYDYDAAGQLKTVTNAETETTSYTYDAVGNLLTITDANNHTTTMSYDALGRQTSRALPLNQVETFRYDVVGNQVAHTDFNGRTTTSSYDELDRRRTIVPDPVLGEPTIGYTYTLTGQRAAMSDASGTTTYAYDNRDRLLEKAT
ncbi:MAG: FG-GAP-like repeat-containing protein, partial [Chloroflexaceae bacterium]